MSAAKALTELIASVKGVTATNVTTDTKQTSSNILKSIEEYLVILEGHREFIEDLAQDLQDELWETEAPREFEGARIFAENRAGRTQSSLQEV